MPINDLLNKLWSIHIYNVIHCNYKRELGNYVQVWKRFLGYNVLQVDREEYML